MILVPSGINSLTGSFIWTNVDIIPKWVCGFVIISWLEIGSIVMSHATGRIVSWTQRMVEILAGDDVATLALRQEAQTQIVRFGFNPFVIYANVGQSVGQPIVVSFDVRRDSGTEAGE